MSIAPSTPALVADPASTPSRSRWERWAWPITIGLYLLASFVMMGHAWTSGVTNHTVTPSGDPALFIWSLQYAANGVAYFNLPLTTPLMFHPEGFNLLANTTTLGLGVPMAPITWIFGPVASMNVLLTLSPVVSGAAMVAALRRHGSWWPAAAAAGALWGFSPFVISGVSLGWLMCIWLVCPPLLWLFMHELIVRRKVRPMVAGLLVALVLTWQLWIGTEFLAITATTGALITVIVLIAQCVTSEDPRGVLRHATVGLVTGGVVLLLLCAYPTWWAVAGPSHLPSWVWPTVFFAVDQVRFTAYFGPSRTFQALAIDLTSPQLNAAFMGWGFMVSIVASAMAAWRDLRFWLVVGIAAFGVATAAANSLWWSPWQLFFRAPLVHNIMGQRWVIVVLFGASMALGIGVSDLVGRLGGSGLTPKLSGIAILIVALGPVIAADTSVLPVPVASTTPPSWFVKPSAHGTVLMTPLPGVIASGLTWEAAAGIPSGLVGGWGPQVFDFNTGPFKTAHDTLVQMTYQEPLGQAVSPRQVLSIRRAVSAWGVNRLLAVSPSGGPAKLVGAPASGSVGLFTEAFGPPQSKGPGWWAWTVLNPSKGRLVSEASSQACLNRWRSDAARIPSCVVAASN
jgi:hypothetical protein